MSLSRATGTHQWLRFWVPRGTPAEFALGGGYFPDPRGDLKALNPGARTTEELLPSYPCLVLLGEPGIGKSHELRAAQTATSLAGGVVLQRELSLPHDLDRDIAEATELVEWRKGQSVLHLFIDAIDEHHEGAHEFARWLLAQLSMWPRDRLHLRLACRAAQLPPSLTKDLARVWRKEAEVGFYTLAPLRRIDVEQAARDADLDPHAFLREVSQKDVAHFSSRPITLQMLLHAFGQKGALPIERRALYESGCLHLCQETSTTRADPVALGSLGVDERLAVASRIAACSVLGRRPLLWLGKQLAPEGALTERDLAGGTEPCGAGEVNVDEGVMRAVLTNTGLFVSGGDYALGWAHRTFVEYLTARYLNMRGLSVDEVFKRLSSPHSPRTIVPGLRETAAWLATMSDDFFHELLRSDPTTLLESDFAQVGPAERAQLVGSIVSKIHAREIVELPSLPNDGQGLNHPRLAEQLQPYITDRKYHRDARTTAIYIAELCGLKALHGDLVRIALDETESHDVRTSAARAIAHVGAPEAKRRLRPLALGVAGADPDDELKGIALKALWPEDLSASDLFECISESKKQNVVGSYRLFLSDQLEQRLSDEDLPQALVWAARIGPRHVLSEYHDIADRIMARAWGRLDDSEVLAGFAMAVKARLGYLESIFGDLEPGEEVPSLEGEPSKRRSLTKAVVEITQESAELEAIVTWRYVHQEPLVTFDDIPWLIEQVVGSPEGLRERWAQILGKTVDYGLPDDFLDQVLTARELHAAVRDATPCFEPIAVDSAEAERLKQEHKERKEREARFQKHEEQSRRKLEPVPEKIEDCLRRIEQGHTDETPRLHQLLAVDVEAAKHAYPSVATDLRDFPGWSRATPGTKARIVEASKRYLNSTSDSADQWVVQDHFWPPAQTGYRCLRLLSDLEPTWVAALPASTWRRWAAAILGARGLNGKEAQRALVAKAYRATPDAVLNRLKSFLKVENSKNERPFTLDAMAQCWDDRLKRFLIDLARRSALAPNFLGGLVGELLGHKVPGAREYAASFLALPLPEDNAARERAVASAYALMVHAEDAGWSAVWPALRSDARVAAETVKKLAQSVGFTSPMTWAKKLSEASAAELYLWLAKDCLRDDEPPEPHGAWESRLDSVVELRDGILRSLEGRGTAEAHARLQELAERLPNRDWSWQLTRSREALEQATWLPLSPKAVLALGRPPTAPDDLGKRSVRRIAFFEANPDRSRHLETTAEYRDVVQRLRATRYRDYIDPRPHFATRRQDLMTALTSERPAIVHFSGHGSATSGIILHGDNGGQDFVSPLELQELFRVAGSGVRLVIFNICSSAEHARAVAEVVGCAIGMRTVVDDSLAREFAVAFYEAIGNGESLQAAFKQGRLAMDLMSPSEDASHDLGPSKQDGDDTASDWDVVELIVAQPEVDPAEVFILQDPQNRRR
jgi:CHAT domain-containing protein